MYVCMANWYGYLFANSDINCMTSSGESRILNLLQKKTHTHTRSTMIMCVYVYMCVCVCVFFWGGGGGLLGGGGDLVEPIYMKSEEK